MVRSFRILLSHLLARFSSRQTDMALHPTTLSRSLILILKKPAPSLFTRTSQLAGDLPMVSLLLNTSILKTRSTSLNSAFSRARSTGPRTILVDVTSGSISYTSLRTSKLSKKVLLSKSREDNALAWTSLGPPSYTPSFEV